MLLFICLASFNFSQLAKYYFSFFMQQMVISVRFVNNKEFIL